MFEPPSWKTARTVLGLALALAACTPQPQAEPPRPIVSPWAAKHAMRTWTEADTRACFGEPRDSDRIAGWPRYRFKRDDCTAYIIFDDGKVHSVEGYGSEQACWWVVEACRTSAPPAGPAARTPG